MLVTAGLALYLSLFLFLALAFSSCTSECYLRPIVFLGSMLMSALEGLSYYSFE